MQRAVFLDRDGTLIAEKNYLHRPEDVEIFPGAGAALKKLAAAGFKLFIITNQSGIGRGMIDMTSVNAVHQHMMKLLAEKGGRLDAVFFCPHAATEQCECRKPAPGLMRDIGERYGVNLDAVPMVCDTLRDLQAAHAAGCMPHLVRTGRAAVADEATIDQWLQEVPGTACSHCSMVASSATAARPLRTRCG